MDAQLDGRELVEWAAWRRGNADDLCCRLLSQGQEPCLQHSDPGLLNSMMPYLTLSYNHAPKNWNFYVVFKIKGAIGIQRTEHTRVPETQRVKSPKSWEPQWD